MTKKQNIFSRFWTWIKNISFWKKALLLLLVVAVCVGLFMWKGKSTKTTSSQKYTTVPVRKADMKESVASSGSLAPLSTTKVGALVSGEILKIYVDYNTVVKKGDLMAIIDPTQIQAAYDQAEASLSTAKEDLATSKMSYDLAKANYNRYKSLYEKDYVAKTDFEQYELSYINAKSSLNSAESRIVQAQASLDRAKKDLDNTRIVSPIDGIVLTKQVSEGQSLTSGFSTPELFILAQDMTKMQIEAKVSETDVVKIKAGQKAEFTLGGYPSEKFHGVVRQVRTNYSGSSQTSTTSAAYNYVVVIDVDNSENKFMPGMIATIDIQTKDKKDVLVVKNEALRFSPSFNKEKFEKTGVWVLDENKNPKRVDVTIGIIDNRNTEILSGDLKEGQEVIVSEEGVTTGNVPEFRRPMRRR
ncbi:MAG: efflux RND transporter periplasmic adaptor subunit [Elusimicrobiaceae bacterium]|nr:efflux RND transporter periplasmic adaptor subunit [Elusimicrobiaceae bacterium]